MLIGATGGVVAGIVAVAGSQLMPIGPLRALEPHRGVDIDVTVVAFGVLAFVILMTMHSVFVAGRRVSVSGAPAAADR